MTEETFSLIGFDQTVPAVRKDRVNETCNMQAWYYQTDTNTFAFARLTGAHGVRDNIPADRKYLVVSGSGEYEINSKKFPVAKGSIVVIKKGQTYDFHSTGSDPLEVFVDIGIKLDLDSIPAK